MCAERLDRPSDVDGALNVTFKYGQKVIPTPEHGIKIIKGSEESFYQFVSFVDCKFQPTGTTTFLDCELDHVEFNDCTFKGTNRFDNTHGTRLEYVKCDFENHWEGDKQHPQDHIYLEDIFKNDPRKTLPIIDFGGCHFFDENRQPIPPPRGIVVKRDNDHAFYFAVNFVNCYFDEEKPVEFKDCAFMDVTFEGCLFSDT